VGFRAGYSTTTGLNNVCVGYEAFYNNTTGQLNTSVGYQALGGNTTGNENTAVGQRALTASTTGYQNTAIGRNALGVATTGYSNTALGQGAGRLITTGANNTIIGRFNGNDGGLDLRTRNNNIVLSDGNGTPRGTYVLITGLIGTTAVDISQNIGTGGLHFVSGYNASNGAQGWWLIGTRVNNIQTIASSNNTGLTVTFGQSSSVRLNIRTSSGSLDNVFCWTFR